MKIAEQEKELSNEFNTLIRVEEHETTYDISSESLAEIKGIMKASPVGKLTLEGKCYHFEYKQNSKCFTYDTG